MPNLAPVKPLPRTKNTECRKLRLEYCEESDALSIMHLDGEGNLLSECCLTPEDAYSYAQSIIEVYDQAVGVD